MKVALIVYHANITKLYKAQWIERFWQSIVRQSYTDFEIYELCYNGGKDRVFEDSMYESRVMPSFVHAMNYLIDKALAEGADVVANCNVDDYYATDWIKTELPFLKYQGFDIVTCNFTLIRNDIPVHIHLFDKMDIKRELERGNNIVAHPAVLYSRNFLENNSYDPGEVPEEDMLLWKRTIDTYKFKIVPENLLFHRLHDNAVCQSTNR